MIVFVIVLLSGLSVFNIVNAGAPLVTKASVRSQPIAARAE